MSNAAHSALKVDPFPCGESIRTRNGTTFAPSTDDWRFSTNAGLRYFDLARFDAQCAPPLALAARKTLAWYLEHRSVLHASNLYQRFVHFLGAVGSGPDAKVESITATLIANYRETLHGKHEWYLGSLRGFFLKWAALGYSGVTQDASCFLEEIAVKGNDKGWAVLTMDEEKGPFTDAEFRLIHGALNKALGDKEINLRQAALAWLFMELGLRSAQAADLKVGDLSVQRKADGTAAYVLEVPRVKQRGQIRRDDFRKRELDPRIGQIVDAWCRQVVEDHGGKKIAGAELPIFPCARRTAKAEPGFELHSDSMLLRGEIVHLFEKLAIVSPRTKEVLKVVPRRFRYTIASRAVIHGAGPEVIAELLDHSDTQNVLVYSKCSDDLIEELNAALADEMEPLAQAFLGKIVLFDKGHLSDPSRLIAYPGLDLKKGYTGRCQCGGECGEVPPMFCYSCPHFTAFKDAPHEEALELMQAEQASERTLGNDVVAQQLDEPIAACRALIKKCKEMS